VWDDDLRGRQPELLRPEGCQHLHRGGCDVRRRGLVLVRRHRVLRSGARLLPRAPRHIDDVHDVGGLLRATRPGPVCDGQRLQSAGAALLPLSRRGRSLCGTDMCPGPRGWPPSEPLSWREARLERAAWTSDGPRKVPRFLFDTGRAAP
jgi:hypothetical protein